MIENLDPMNFDFDPSHLDQILTSRSERAWCSLDVAPFVRFDYKVYTTDYIAELNMN